MDSANSFYDYIRPEKTYTIDQFIECQSETNICYNNLSFIDQYNNIKFNTYNVLSDYIDEIKETYCLKITMNDDQLSKYKYRPKLLCYDIYGSQELAFIVLIINDMYSAKQFTKYDVLMPTKDGMSQLCKYIYNSNKEAISIYNEKNNNDK